MVTPDLGDCDRDNDGVTSVACGGADCDDSDAERFAGNRERCEGQLGDGRSAADHDEDCDPCTVTGRGIDGDRDGDFYLSGSCTNTWIDDSPPSGCDPNYTILVATSTTVSGTDCNDGDGDVHPNQAEVCGDDVDNNCDGDSDVGVLFRDVDHDGRGDPTTTRTGDCAVGWVTNDDDCDDTTPWTYAGAAEVCDDRDNDCSLPGTLRGGVELEDLDGDGSVGALATCIAKGEPGVLPFWPVMQRADCDDDDQEVGPHGVEACGNGEDDDCNGVVDDQLQSWCRDGDGDGAGNANDRIAIVNCVPTTGYVPDCGDCDDANPTRYPASTEWCDRVDNNCDWMTPLAEDADLDGHSTPSSPCIGSEALGAPNGVYPRDDCNDAAQAIYPGARELCDGVDSNCSEGGNGNVSLIEDADGDFHSPATADCTMGFPRTDCDDSSSAIHAGVAAAQDTNDCNGVDNDCNPATSELRNWCPTGGYCGEAAVCRRGPAVIATTVGQDHTCALLADGTVQCWGGNSSGQLGVGHTTPSAQPLHVSGLTGVRAISAGAAHTCALINDGSVRCWGGNSSRQLGDGTVTTRLTPTPVVGVSGVVELASGERHVCALRGDGTARCWGESHAGQLGTGNNNVQVVPATVVGLTGATSLTAGGGRTCAILTDRTVWCWGSSAGNLFGAAPVGHPTVPTQLVGLANVESIGLAAAAACVLFQNGSVSCWGDNFFGQLGDGTNTNRVTPAPVPGQTNVRAITAKGYHFCALRDDASVSCWGRDGLLGDGTLTPQTSPVTPIGLANVTTIEAGTSHSCATLGDGSVRCWGSNYYGQLGDGTTLQRLVPSMVPGLAGASLISAGTLYSCAVVGGGEAWCWGANVYSQLGNGTNAPAYTPTRVVGLTGIRSLSTAFTHACASLADGTAWCWGNNGDGQLGNGTTSSSALPVMVPGLTNVSAVVCGEQHTCAVLGNGSVSCWGASAQGQVGNGATADVLLPTTIAGVSGVVAVAVARSSTCAVAMDGRVWCWGSNTGNSPTTTSLVPALVVGLTGVTGVATGVSHTCAVRADGSVVCWGAGASGQLGNGLMNNSLTPTLVSNINDAVSIAMSPMNHTCVRRQDGTASCWGSNASGQLGDGSTTTRAVPTTVPGLDDVTALTLGSTHTCALRASDTIVCWGDNQRGQLGDGTTDSSLVPSAIWEL